MSGNESEDDQEQSLSIFDSDDSASTDINHSDNLWEKRRRQHSNKDGEGSDSSTSDSSDNSSYGSIARDRLRDAEHSGDSTRVNSGKAETGAQDLKEAEAKTGATGGFRTDVRGLKKKSVPTTRRELIKMAAKRGGPATAIVAFLAIAILSTVSPAATLLFSLRNVVAEGFGSAQKASAYERTKVFERWQTYQYTEVKDPIKKGSIFKKSKFKLSDKQIDKYEKNGIKFQDMFVGDNGGAVKVGVFVDSLGNEFNVVSDPRMVDRVKNYNELNHQKNIRVYDYDTLNRHHTEFHKQSFAASATWRGHMMQWFDSSMMKLTRYKPEINRNAFYDWEASQNEKNDQAKIVAKIKEYISGRRRKKGKVKHSEQQQEDVDGSDSGTNPNKPGDGADPNKPETDDFDSDVKQHTEEIDFDSEIDTKKSVGKALSDGLSDISGLQAATCGVSQAVSGIGNLASAIKKSSALTVASLFLEAPDKAMAKDLGVFSGDSPMNQLANLLVKPAKATLSKYDQLTKKSTDAELYGSAMAAEPIVARYAGRLTRRDDPVVESFSIGGVLGTLLTVLRAVGVGTTNGAPLDFEGCANAQIADSIQSIGTDAAEIAACIGSAGASCVGSLIKNAALDIAIDALISTVTAVVTPAIMNMVKNSFSIEPSGPVLGAAIAIGSSIFMAKNFQQGGGAPASVESMQLMAAAERRVIADEARYQRATRSPFDGTSIYTFMGTLQRNLQPLYASIYSPLQFVHSGIQTMASAYRALSPSVAAASDAEMINQLKEESDKYCPEQAAIGTIADAACTPIMNTDMNTLSSNEWHPAHVENHLAETGQFTETDSEDTQPQIAPGSNLAKHILYCSERESDFGILDDNIASDVQSVNIESNIGSSVVDNIPIVGDVVNIMSNVEQVENLGYITGKACVIGAENPDHTGENPYYYDHPEQLEGGANSKKVDALRDAEEKLKEAEGMASGTDDEKASRDQAIKEAGSAKDTAEDIKITQTWPSWAEARYYQRYIEDQRLSESMGLIEKSNVTAFLEDHYEKHPKDNSAEGILARKTGMSKDKVIASLEQLGEMVYLANYDQDANLPFRAPVIEPLKIAVENHRPQIGEDYLILNQSDIDLRRDYFVTA